MSLTRPLTRRAALSAALVGLVSAPAIVRAQGRWSPTQPVRIIIPFGPGGTMDPVVRVAQGILEADLGQPIVVEHRPGAATVVGATETLRAAPDGHTIFMMANSFAANPTLRPSTAGNWLTAFAPVAQAVVVPHVLAVHPSVANDFQGFLAAGRRQGGAGLSWGSYGVGTSNHLGGEQFVRLAGLNATHVPYNGPAQAHLDMTSGRLQFMLANLPDMVQPANTGAIRAVAISAERRAKELPNTPTMAEVGFPLVLSDSWFGWVVRSETPAPIRERLEAAFLAALNRPEVRGRLEDLAFTVLARPSGAFTQEIRKYHEAYAEVIRTAGIRIVE